MLDEKDKIIEQLQKTIAEQNAIIAELKSQLANALEKLNMNSNNSSKPPSSDGYKKPSPKSLRTKTGNAKGAQPGHKGHNITLPHKPDNNIQHLPDKCLHCPHLNECKSNEAVFSCAESRYTVDVEVKTIVTEHQRIIVNCCPYGEKPDSGRFSENIKGYIQYGDSVAVLAGILNTYGAVSIMRTHLLLSSLIGMPISTGTVNNLVARCADRVKSTLSKIKRLITESGLCHFDETGVRADGKLKWVHNSSTADYTYQTLNDRRGRIGIEANGVISCLSGTAVHDCWSPYRKYGNVNHAVCNAHLLRELIGISETHPEHKWATSFIKLLLTMKAVKEKAINEGKTVLSYYYLHKFSREYDNIMELADKECPLPPKPSVKKRGRQKKGKERSLIERLISLKLSVCLFIHDFSVPFDNNQAERDLRNIKTKAKVSGCFRSDKGGQDYLDVMSYLNTGAKHNINAFDAMTAAFSGDGDIVLSSGF